MGEIKNLLSELTDLISLKVIHNLGERNNNNNMPLREKENI